MGVNVRFGDILFVMLSYSGDQPALWETAVRIAAADYDVFVGE